MTPPDWNTEASTWRKYVLAVSSPLMAGGIVFACAVILAVLLVLVRPGDADADAPALAGAAGDMTIVDSPGAIETSTVMVHVSGSVHDAGVIELEHGSRVEAAITAAGGATDTAELGGINLARVIIDGEHIVVPDVANVGEQSASGTPGLTPDGRINLNHADAQALETLPKIGPALAARIIEWRDTHGGFTRIEDLTQVSGIGDAVFAQLRELVIAP